MAAQLVETALDQAEGDRLSGRLGARWNTSMATSSAASCTRTLSVCLAK
jgi:hypothetical protein